MKSCIAPPPFVDSIGAMATPAVAVPAETECFEKKRLLAAYRAAASDYSRVVMLLSEKSGVMLKDDYIQIRDYSEKARHIAEAARRAFDEHVKAHACGPL